MRISQTPPAALIATHAALASGVHGAVGTIVGTSDAESLTNKTFLDDLLISNPDVDAGAHPSPKLILDGGHGATEEKMTMHLEAVSSTNYRIVFLDKAGVTKAYIDYVGNFIGSGAIEMVGDLTFKSSTAFILTLAHAISANRIVTLPDKDITVADNADIKVIQVISFNDTEISSGTPILSNEDGQDQLATEWDFNQTGERIRSKTTFTPPDGFNKLKIQALMKATTSCVAGFHYSLNTGAVTAMGTANITTTPTIFESSELAVVDAYPVRVFIDHTSGGVSLYLYDLKLIWYQ